MTLAGQGVEADPAAAALLLEMSGSLGSARAMARLGHLSRLGAKNFPKDFPQAMVWYERSLKIAVLDETLNGMGQLYRQGLGVPADPVKARGLFEQAIAKGSVDAMVHLAGMLDGGVGGPSDRPKALTLVREALIRSNQLHPDNRKLAEAWAARGDKGMAFQEPSGGTRVASGPKLDAAPKIKDEEINAILRLSLIHI